MAVTARIVAAAFFVAVFGLITDRLVLPYLEANYGVAGRLWKDENKKRFVFNCYRNGATNQAPVWQSWGVKFDEHKLDKPRIMVMGDSFVWGDSYLNMNDMWWRQLESELKRRGYDVEVIAAGRPGYSLHQEVNTVGKLLKTYHPDVIIWGYDSNDCDEGKVVGYAFQRPKFLSAIDRLCFQLAPNLHERVGKKLNDAISAAIGTSKNLGADYNEWELKLLQGENFAAFKQTVARLSGFHKTTGVPGFVLTLPQVPSAEHFACRFNPIKAVMQSQGVPFVDIAREFADSFGSSSQRLVGDSGEVRPIRWGINPANPHPNACATHFFAVKAADYLCSHYRNYLGPIKFATHQPPVGFNDSMPAVVVLNDAADKDAFILAYPRFDEMLLAEPGQNGTFLQLNLTAPQHLHGLSLTGAQLKGAQISISRYSTKLGYNTDRTETLGAQSGSNLQWDIDKLVGTCGDPIASIRLTAKFTGPDRVLHLKLAPRALIAGGKVDL